MRVIFILLLLLNLVMADDYYQRLDRFLGGTVGILAQANALPIITGVIDEARKSQGADKVYYETAALLADTKNNYAWRAYQNSRKNSVIYSSAKAEDVFTAKAGSGAVADFLDQISGSKYKKAEENYGRSIFVRNFRKGVGSADIYIENIGVVSSKLLQDLFEVELPELPSDGKTIPKLDIPSLDKFQEKIERSVRGDESDLRSHWKLSLHPLGSNAVPKGKNVYSLSDRETVEIGLKIVGPDGKLVLNKQQLGSYVPYVTLLPLPEGELPNLQFVDTKSDISAPKLTKETSGIRFFGKFEDIRPNEPVEISYQIGEDIRALELDISNSKGQSVYLLKESRPDPKSPLPLVWKPEPGDYRLELRALDVSGKIQSAEPELIRVSAKPRETRLNSLRVPNNQNGEFFGTFKVKNVNSSSFGLEKVYAWLYGSEENDRPFSASIYFSFARFSPHKSRVYSLDSVELGQKTQIYVQLLTEQGVPVPNAPVSLFSRRNLYKQVDVFDKETQRTNAQGEAIFTFWSQVPGEAEIYALSDLIWLAEPVIVKVGRKER